MQTNSSAFFPQLFKVQEQYGLIVLNVLLRLHELEMNAMLMFWGCNNTKYIKITWEMNFEK